MNDENARVNDTKRGEIWNVPSVVKTESHSPLESSPSFPNHGKLGY